MSMVSIVFAGLIVAYSLKLENIKPPFSNLSLSESRQNKVEWVSESEDQLMKANEVKEPGILPETSPPEQVSP